MTSFDLHTQAIVNSDLNKLLEVLGSNAKFNWIKRRIKGLWPKWSDALKQLQRVKPFKHKKKRVSKSQLSVYTNSMYSVCMYNCFDV